MPKPPLELLIRLLHSKCSLTDTTSVIILNVNKLNYLLIPLIAAMLVSAQACWGSFIKSTKPFNGPVGTIIGNLVTGPRIWLGALLYICATLVYFLALSKLRFFTIQLSVTALAIILSTTLSRLLFHESLTALNIIGMLLMLGGVGLVLAR